MEAESLNESSTNKVFITNYIAHDYSPAEKYGTLVAITRNYVSFASLDRIVSDIAEKINNAKATDYLLLSGTNIVCVIAAILWYEKFKTVKLLTWDKKLNNYVELTLDRIGLDKLFAIIEKE